MQYLVNNSDGTVAIVILVPNGLLRDATLDKSPILGVRTRRGKLLLYNENIEVEIGDDNYQLGELQPGHIKGYTILFPDIMDVIAKWSAPAREKVSSVEEISFSEVPQDRTFRGAWTGGTNGIAVDMPKAREIHRNRIREARAPMLAKMDVEFMLASERKDDAAIAKISASKKLLRDVTLHPDIDAATTPDELKATMESVWPKILEVK